MKKKNLFKIAPLVLLHFLVCQNSFGEELDVENQSTDTKTTLSETISKKEQTEIDKYQKAVYKKAQIMGLPRNHFLVQNAIEVGTLDAEVRKNAMNEGLSGVSDLPNYKSSEYKVYLGALEGYSYGPTVLSTAFQMDTRDGKINYIFDQKRNNVHGYREERFKFEGVGQSLYKVVLDKSVFDTKRLSKSLRSYYEGFRIEDPILGISFLVPKKYITDSKVRSLTYLATQKIISGLYERKISFKKFLLKANSSVLEKFPLYDLLNLAEKEVFCFEEAVISKELPLNEVIASLPEIARLTRSTTAFRTTEYWNSLPHIRNEDLAEAINKRLRKETKNLTYEVLSKVPKEAQFLIPEIVKYNVMEKAIAKGKLTFDMILEMPLSEKLDTPKGIVHLAMLTKLYGPIWAEHVPEYALEETNGKMSPIAGRNTLPHSI